MRIPLKTYRKNGLHVRMAARFIPFLQKYLPNQDGIKHVHIVYNGKKVQVNNLLALVSLKIKPGETFYLDVDGDLNDETVNDIQQFFLQPEKEDAEQMETDRLLMENSLTLQEAISAIPNGIVVCNRDLVITYVNRAAATLFNQDPQQMLNKRADGIIPNGELQELIETKQPVVTNKLQLNRFTVIATYSPIILNDHVIGIVAIFQDITGIEKISKELKEVKELQQRLDLLLHSVSDLIGMTDQSGQFIYMNEVMDLFLKKNPNVQALFHIIGKEEWSKLTKGQKSIMKVIEVGEQSFVTKVNPIYIDKQLTGTVTTMTRLDDVKKLLDKIELMKQRTEYLEEQLSKHEGLHSAFNAIIGTSNALKDALKLAQKISGTDSTVLITGESGTGKELVARAIHEAGKRKKQPYIRVNCAAIPPTLMESELFGYEKGAFTGATNTKRGKFELAHKGTIFLDEIGDLPIELQAKLLRVLQEKEIVRLGGYEPIQLDVRVIAATNRDLKKLVDEGKFREDLYYRLHVVPIHLPPLRNRKDDIPLLTESFVKQLNKELGKNIKGYEKGFIESLTQYNWPGNIRELKNLMERMISLSETDYLLCKDLPHYIFSPEQTETKANTEQHHILLNKNKTLKQYEKEIYKYACQHYQSFNQIAKALGVTHKTVAKKVREYGLESLIGK
ncbi:sigma 54-interacting transcriptional regulator [Fervidibacillus albus]|uniref:HTH-type transcriptional regulatory protein TyrR n=1 Tax=Fervidibacillus albus TaxID=2980026 RepID=A0A9E8LY83_9BACI|nr:sigma 54-interacting transcriptional regulator [Fervidibacillus albus]WAA10959.1 sigma 54-interacting transcriptional regulator [Fervidibacillus albus]